MKYLIIFINFCFFIACNSSKNPIGPKLGEELELKYEQSVNLCVQNLTIKFTSVIEDSRCPTGLVCIWEGNAEVAIEVNQIEFALNTTLGPKEIKYSVYKIRLISVSPYPVTNEQINIEDYKLKLVITK